MITMEEEINIKEEIVESYKTLISDCEKSINKGVEVEKNKQLLKEYRNILNQVLVKSDDTYKKIVIEMKRMSKFSL